MMKSITSKESKTFRSLRRRQWFKGLGVTLAVAGFDIACYLGMPEYTRLLGGGTALKVAMDVALAIRKEENEWRKHAGSENPMYFVWRLRSGH